MVLQMAEKHLSMFMVALFCFYKADMQRVKVEGAALMLRTQKLVHFLQNICCDVAETSNLLAFAYILFLCAEKACESIEIETGNYLKPTSYPRNADFRHLDRELGLSMYFAFPAQPIYRIAKNPINFRIVCVSGSDMRKWDFWKSWKGHVLFAYAYHNLRCRGQSTWVLKFEGDHALV